MALSVQQSLTKNSMTPVPHPPYSPDLDPSKFFVCFPQMKKVLKGKHFVDVEEVKQTKKTKTKKKNPAEALKGIKIDKFKNCFEQ